MPLRVMFMAGSMEGGGSERQTLRLLERMDRCRITPELYLTYRRGTLIDELPRDLAIHSASDQPFRPRFNWPGRIHKHLTNAFESLLVERKIDVVYDRTFHMTLIAADACRRLGIPRVSTIVSPPSLDLPGTEKRYLGLKRARLARAYREASKVFAVSQAVRTDAAAYYGLPTSKIDVLHSGVDLAQIERERALPLEAILPVAWRDDLVSRKSWFHVACVGRLREEKGQRFLFESLEYLKRQFPQDLDGLMLWLVGDGPDRGLLERLASHYGLESNVRFLGHLQTAIPLIAQCQLLISPSRYEGWSNAILEAFACRVPVIATRVGGSEEMLIDQRLGRLVRYDSWEELANAIRLYRHHPEIAMSCAEEARKHLLKSWQMDEVVARLSTACEEVAKRT